jgi:hypothetical protein
MEWRSLEEFPSYQFSDTGLVKKGDKYVNVHFWGRYPAVSLSNGFMRKRFRIHRVVALLFIGPCPDGQMVRHLDDDPENNNVSNLAYGTREDNIADAIRNERFKKGDEHHSRINPECMASGDRNGARTHPESLSRGDKHWTKLDPEKLAKGNKHGSKTHPERVARGERCGASKLTQEAVDEIRATENYYGCVNALAKKFNVNRQTITKVRKHETW